MTTPRFSIPELAAAQAQKHVTVNEALRVIDAAMNLVVASRALTDPPTDPDEGAKFIPASPAGGVWVTHENEVAAFVNGQWRFFSPEIGWRAFDQATAKLAIWDGTEWTDFAGGGTQPMLGINTAADATNRLAVKSDAVLFSHDDVTPGSGDVRFVVNKAAAGNTASLLFQTGFSGRGEVGLAGSDALSLKASADGVSFDDILTFDPASHALKLTLDGAERLRVDANGNVGIGTMSPQVRLDVEANLVDFAARIVNSGNSFTRRGLSLQGGNVNDFNFLQAKSFDGSRIVDFWIDEGALRLDFGGSEKLRVDPAGYVGINTGAPLRPLHVNNGTAGPITGLSGSTAAIFQNDASNCFIQLISSGSNVSDVIFGTAASAQLGRLRYSANADYLSLWTGGAEKMRLDTNGNVLIGTTTSFSKFDVNAGGGAGSVANAMLLNGGVGGTLGSGARLYLSAGNGPARSVYIEGVNVNGSGNAHDLVFGTSANTSAPVERMRIGSDGEVSAQGIYSATTASAANVFVETDGTLKRSTSSAKYKTEIADMTAPERGVLMDLRPISYLSTCQGDDAKRRHFGLIAEEVFEVSPSLVHLGADRAPEGVMYERIVPHLIAGHQAHEARIAALEAKH